MVNINLLTAEICWRVWGRDPCKFQRVSRLGSVTARHSTCCTGRQPNVAALNRGRHLYSAGRPSRWVLAHVLVMYTTVFAAVRLIVVGLWLTFHRSSQMKHMCEIQHQPGVECECLCCVCISATLVICQYLPSVLWHCSLGIRNSVREKLSDEVRWRGCLSGARCKWFAYRPADATATPPFLASLKSRLV